MKPKPFITEPYEDDDRFVRNTADGLVWHRCRYRTLYADTDRSQVVYHSNYLRYFEFGRASLMRDVAYSYREIEANGYLYPIIEIGLKYYNPLYYDDSMWIHTHFAKIERVRLQFDYTITHPESRKLICQGFTRHCAVNLSGKPVAIDEKTVQLWNMLPK
jgi:acyl-CoA thioester hydrolase